jgi:hypothetical protein
MLNPTSWYIPLKGYDSYGRTRSPTHFLSSTNETNLSLSSVKFDFSLVKVDAPAEFAPMGSALTTRRRSEAEDGPQHRTARRLAALFEELIPSTPNLVTMYGRRVSEIIQQLHVNPRGSSSHGPFKDFIGADATAMWAAAPFGIPALGVYLLACLLARAWDAAKSVSIWVELVSDRRLEIEKAFQSNAIVSESSLVGSRQEISRHDLALLDASERSWLRSADRGKQWEHDQLRLILENIPVPFPSGVIYVRRSDVVLAAKKNRKSASSTLSTHPLRRRFYQHSL